MKKLINDLDKKISKAQSITGNLFNDLEEIRTSFNKLKEAINYTRCCKSDSEHLKIPKTTKEQRVQLNEGYNKK
jgi:hypothetical protein